MPPQMNQQRKIAIKLANVIPTGRRYVESVFRVTLRTLKHGHEPILRVTPTNRCRLGKPVVNRIVKLTRSVALGTCHVLAYSNVTVLGYLHPLELVVRQQFLIYVLLFLHLYFFLL